RAKRLHETLDANRLTNSRPAHEIMDWISLFALALRMDGELPAASRSGGARSACTRHSTRTA
ncbi:hypothetical protein CTI14_68130, partial [Methylobacterium radiotolerans]